MYEINNIKLIAMDSSCRIIFALTSSNMSFVRPIRMEDKQQQKFAIRFIVFS